MDYLKKLASKYPGVLAGIVVIIIAAIVIFWGQVPSDGGLANVGMEIDTTVENGTQSQEPNTSQEQEEEINEEQQEELAGQKPASSTESYQATRGALVVAQKGEGVTHLARRALALYLDAEKPSTALSIGHKIYIEDYLKDNTAKNTLQPGERLEFSRAAIQGAVEAASGLSQDQLAGIANRYAKHVPSLMAYIPVL